MQGLTVKTGGFAAKSENGADPTIDLLRFLLLLPTQADLIMIAKHDIRNLDLPSASIYLDLPKNVKNSVTVTASLDLDPRMMITIT